MPYHDQIEIDSRICSGKPVIRGTRILVTSILSQLAAGESFDSIRAGFPGLPTRPFGPLSSLPKTPLSPPNSLLFATDHRLFIDQNVRLEVAVSLRADAHAVIHASEAGLAERDDETILRWATERGLAVVCFPPPRTVTSQGLLRLPSG